MRLKFCSSLAGVLMLAVPLTAVADSGTAGASNLSLDPSIPAWLFPSNSTSGAPLDVDPGERVGLAGSDVTYMRSELGNLHSAVDWHPTEHEPMPEVVAHGRGAEVYACGYCHTPTGQGRPENAALAGLPAAYIEEQVAAFAAGARRSASGGAYHPADLMRQTAEHVSRADLMEAAEYFSHQMLRSRVRVVEASRVPRSRVIGLVYCELPGGGLEDLGERLMEFSPTASQHEMRDDRMQYLAYVPVGSVARGSAIANGGIKGKVNACVTCHGPQLRGVGPAPPLAGRSPTYLLRSLFAFRGGQRTGGTAELMAPIARALDAAEMIALSAYAASLPP